MMPVTELPIALLIVLTWLLAPILLIAPLKLRAPVVNVVQLPTVLLRMTLPIPVIPPLMVSFEDPAVVA